MSPASPSSTAAMRGCSDGRAWASLKAAMTTVSGSRCMARIVTGMASRGQGPAFLLPLQGEGRDGDGVWPGLRRRWGNPSPPNPSGPAQRAGRSFGPRGSAAQTDRPHPLEGVGFNPGARVQTRLSVCRVTRRRQSLSLFSLSFALAPSHSFLSSLPFSSSVFFSVLLSFFLLSLFLFSFPFFFFFS